jgi:hypothetical protein
VVNEVERIRRAAHAILAVVALVGAVLSYASLYAAAVHAFGPVLAAGFPLLVDALVLGASLKYVAGAKVGRARPGWRLTAHAGVGGTVLLNALAAPDLAGVPWHVAAPVVWSVLVELTAREAVGDWRAEHSSRLERIPSRLWLTAPVESGRTWLRQARTGQANHAAARLDVGRQAAAAEALRLAIPGRSGRRVRRVLFRQLRAGSLPAAAVLAACGWHDRPDPAAVLPARTPESVLRAALGAVLLPHGHPAERRTSERTGPVTGPLSGDRPAPAGAHRQVGGEQPQDGRAAGLGEPGHPVGRRPAAGRPGGR